MNEVATSRLVKDRGARALVSNADVSRVINLALRNLQVTG